MPQPHGPLHGLRVLDLTRVLAGPFCSMMMADMGAEIIKIEQPGTGDDTRNFAPFHKGESAYYMQVNRNKIGITLNLKGKGRDLFLRMVRNADVVLENYRPGTMERLGLGYEELRAVNPRIVYGCVSGFGHNGPYSQRPGYDILAQAMGGLMSVTGWPGGQPTRSGVAMGDVLAGLSITIGVLAALRHRDQTGQGQKIDVALLDSVVACLEAQPQIYFVQGRDPSLTGNRYEPAYPYDSFATRDGSMVIGVGNDKLFVQFCDIMGCPELAQDPRFATNIQRVAHHAELRPLIEDWTRTFDAAELVDKLVNLGIPAGPINSVSDLVRDPQLAARDMFCHLDHPVAGPLTVTGSQFKFSETPASVRTPAPTLGQDNVDVYKRLLGLSEAEIEALREERVI